MKGWDVSRHIAFGGTRQAELRALYVAASRLPGNATVVEIGSAQGRATLVLAQALCDGNGGIVHTIDPMVYNKSIASTWVDNEPILRENIARSGLRNIEVIKDISSRVGTRFDRSIHLLFIDGDHSYEAVRSDFELFEPRVVSGGVIALHDVGVCAGPRRLAREEVYGSPRFSGIRTVRTMLVAVKRPGPRGSQWFHRTKHGAYYLAASLAGRLR